MKTSPRIWLWAALVALQVAVCGWMIAHRELVLASGTEVRLRLRPVDPVHPFRGRYLNLTYEVENTDAAIVGEWSSGGGAELVVGPDGYAALGRVSQSPRGKLWVRVERPWSGSKRIVLTERCLFVNENRAPELEKEVAQLLRQTPSPVVYATARVDSGTMVLTGLWAGDRQLK